MKRPSDLKEPDPEPIVPDVPLDYFQNHQCALPLEKITSRNIRCGKIRRFILDTLSVNVTDVRAQRLYMSYAALAAEKFRQYSHYPFSIHPYSKLRSCLEACFFLTIFVGNVVLAVKLAQRDAGRTDFLWETIEALDYFYVFHIFINFFTGYIAGETQKVAVLDLNSIFCNYARTWLLLDGMSVVSAFVNRHTILKQVSTEVLIMLLNVLRLPRMICYSRHTFTAINAGVKLKTAVDISLILSSYITWNIIFQFAVEYIYENAYYTTTPRNCSWITLAHLWDQPAQSRIVYALERAVAMSRESANISMISSHECFELFFTVAWICAKLTTFGCTLRYIIVLFGTESARAKYFMMSQQVQKFMNQKKFPPKLKRKILKYYEIKFQSHFFVESRMMECISGQLREDIIMHLSRQMVQNVTFFKQLPKSLLIQIGFTIKADIFLAGDIIYKINTIGECAYFIDKGTVAEYSESGWEIWHLEDGDYFGEIALVMKHKYRTTSAVAVTNCELFKLDREGFESSVACYPVVYEHIKKVAQIRYEQTCVLDEFYKAQLRMKENPSKS